MPESGQPKAPSPDLAEIERISTEFQDLAATVAERISAFEQWFNALPGKAEVSVWRDEDAPEPAMLLKISRPKDVWKLSFGAGADDQGYVTMRPLDDASLSDKCRAVALLPELLQQFYDEQRAAVERLKKAAGVFAQLPKLKGGK